MRDLDVCLLGASERELGKWSRACGHGILAGVWFFTHRRVNESLSHSSGRRSDISTFNRLQYIFFDVVYNLHVRAANGHPHFMHIDMLKSRSGYAVPVGSER